MEPSLSYEPKKKYSPLFFNDSYVAFGTGAQSGSISLVTAPVRSSVPTLKTKS